MSAGYLACAFDLLNIRDLDLIAQAASHCSRLTVGVFSDEFVEQVSGQPPVVPFVERAELLSHVRGVADVVVHDSDRAFLGPDTILFDVSDRPSAMRAGRVTILTPRRESTSTILQDALRTRRGETHGAVA